MKATIVDLRYRMRDVLKALERNEEVEILYHGKIKGVILPVDAASRSHAVKQEHADQQEPTLQVKAHPFFAMDASGGDVEAHMDALRGGRHRAV